MSDKIKKILVDLIEEAADTQSRVELSQELIHEYAESIKEGVEFPPIDVFHDGKQYFIGDGWHRFHAWVAADWSIIPCLVHNGTERDAMMFAAAANKSHGLKRSNGDKRRAVQIVLKDREGAKWSDGKIAEHCGVSQQFVSKVRDQVTTVVTSKARQVTTVVTSTPEKREGRDGKSYPVKPKPATPSVQESEDEEAPEPTIEEQMTAWNRAVEIFARSITDLGKTAPRGGWWDESQANITQQQLKSAAGSARQAKCDKVCPICGGSGCKRCHETGFMPKRTYEMAGGQ